MMIIVPIASLYLTQIAAQGVYYNTLATEIYYSNLSSKKGGFTSISKGKSYSKKGSIHGTYSKGYAKKGKAAHIVTAITHNIFDTTISSDMLVNDNMFLTSNNLNNQEQTVNTVQVIPTTTTKTTTTTTTINSNTEQTTIKVITNKEQTRDENDKIIEKIISTTTKTEKVNDGPSTTTVTETEEVNGFPVVKSEKVIPEKGGTSKDETNSDGTLNEDVTNTDGTLKEDEKGGFDIVETDNFLIKDINTTATLAPDMNTTETLAPNTTDFLTNLDTIDNEKDTKEDIDNGENNEVLKDSCQVMNPQNQDNEIPSQLPKQVINFEYVLRYVKSDTKVSDIVSELEELIQNDIAETIFGCSYELNKKVVDSIIEIKAKEGTNIKESTNIKEGTNIKESTIVSDFYNASYLTGLNDKGRYLSEYDGMTEFLYSTSSSPADEYGECESSDEGCVKVKGKISSYYYQSTPSDVQDDISKKLLAYIQTSMKQGKYVNDDIVKVSYLAPPKAQSDASTTAPSSDTRETNSAAVQNSSEQIIQKKGLSTMAIALISTLAVLATLSVMLLLKKAHSKRKQAKYLYEENNTNKLADISSVDGSSSSAGHSTTVETYALESSPDRSAVTIPKEENKVSLSKSIWSNSETNPISSNCSSKSFTSFKKIPQKSYLPLQNSTQSFVVNDDSNYEDGGSIEDGIEVATMDYRRGIENTMSF